MTEFDKFMEKVLDPVEIKPDPEAIADRMLAMDLGRMERIVIVRGPRYFGPSLAEMILNLQRELKEPKPLPQRINIEPSNFFLNALAELEREMRADAMPEPEKKAKNGAKANRKTAKAKAVIPFYHKNRRF